MLDMSVLDNMGYICISLENRFLVFLQLFLGTNNKDRLKMKYCIIRMPAEVELSEAVFHLDTFTKRAEGERKEEIIVLLKNNK
jgi:hypothetical protein